MLSLIQHIPIAVLQSISFMAVLFVMYHLIKWLPLVSASFLYMVLVLFQLLGATHFIWVVFQVNNILVIEMAHTSVIYTKQNWLFILGIVYCLFFLGYFIHLILQWKQLEALKSKADFSSIKNLQSLLPSSYRHIKVGTHPNIHSPLTFGWLEEVILLPVSMLNHLSQEEIKYILLHELAHIIRKDFLIQLLVELAHSIIYFNPFSYFFVKELGTQREMACDAWVVKQTNNTLAYTKVLYQIAQQHKNEHPFSLQVLGSSQNELLIRIKKMHQIKTVANKIIIKQIGLAIMLCVLLQSIQVNPNMMSRHQVYHLKKTNTSRSLTVKLMNEDHPINTNNHPRKVHKDKQSIISSKVNIMASKIEAYNNMVAATANWIKLREDPAHFANYTYTNDSIDFDIAEKMILRSVLKSYQLKKAMLDKELATMQSEQEGMEYLQKSKAWHEVLQYEKWTSTFLEKHPTALMQLDSLRRF